MSEMWMGALILWCNRCWSFSCFVCFSLYCELKSDKYDALYERNMLHVAMQVWNVILPKKYLYFYYCKYDNTETKREWVRRKTTTRGEYFVKLNSANSIMVNSCLVSLLCVCVCVWWGGRTDSNRSSCEGSSALKGVGMNYWAVPFYVKRAVRITVSVGSGCQRSCRAHAVRRFVPFWRGDWSDCCRKCRPIIVLVESSYYLSYVHFDKIIIY